MEAYSERNDKRVKINKNWVFDMESSNCYIVRYTKDSDEVDSVWNAFQVNSLNGPDSYIHYVKFVDGIPLGVLRRVAKLLEQSDSKGYVECNMMESA